MRMLRCSGLQQVVRRGHCEIRAGSADDPTNRATILVCSEFGGPPAEKGDAGRVVHPFAFPGKAFTAP